MLINRYLLREVTLTFTAVIAVLIIIFLSHRFARYLAESVAGNLTSDVLFILVGFNFITSLMVLIPIALFFSILLALGRLYKDSEMIVLLACGVSQWQVLRSIMYLGIALSTIVGILSIYVTPWAIGKIEALKMSSKSISRFTGMQPGQFKLFQQGQRVFYFENYQAHKGIMHSVVVYQAAKKGTDSHFITAEQGEFVTDKKTGAVLLVLTNGYQYQGQAGRANYHITQFKKNAIRLQKRSASQNHLRRRALPLSRLWQSDNVYFQAELQWRLSMPFGTAILAFLAVPLARTTPRQGMFGKLFVAILIYIGYNNLLGVGRTWIEKKVLPTEIGLWWVHILFLIGAFLMMYYANNGRLPSLLKNTVTKP